jgi:hypothetical protein
VAGGHLIAIDMQPLFQTKEYEVCIHDFVLEFYVYIYIYIYIYTHTYIYIYIYKYICIFTYICIHI